MAWIPREVETARLRLRPLTPGDLDAIHRIWTEPSVRKHLWDGEEIPRERAEKVLARNTWSFEESGYGVWGVFDKDGDELIGFCGFRAFGNGIELIYGLTASRWGKGLASEAAGAGTGSASRRLDSSASRRPRTRRMPRRCA